MSAIYYLQFQDIWSLKNIPQKDTIKKKKFVGCKFKKIINYTYHILKGNISLKKLSIPSGNNSIWNTAKT